MDQGRCLEAAALLAAVVLRIPSLWEELSQDLLFALGGISGERTAGAGGAPSYCGTARLLAEGVASALPSARELLGSPVAAAAAVALLCLLGEGQANEGHYIAAFRALRRAATLAHSTRNASCEDRAAAALEGLRTAALQRWHFHMLNDVARSMQYERAISASVANLRPRPDVTAAGGVLALDIGTGTGLLAVVCARLEGVRAVHACEVNDVLCDVAREVVAASTRSDIQRGVRDCEVSLHHVASTELRMPEKADLIFCEVFDAGLLGEHALPTICHAREALLKDDGILIPARATIFGQVLESPALLERFLVRGTLAGGLLACPTTLHLRPSAGQRYACERLVSLPHNALTEPAPLFRLDFTDTEALRNNLGVWTDMPLELPGSRDGVAHALAFWWELELDDASMYRITNAPFPPSEASWSGHWEQAIMPLVPCVRVRRAEPFTMHLRIRSDGFDCVPAEEGEDDSFGSGQVSEGSYTFKLGEQLGQAEASLELGEEEFLKLNDSAHWDRVRQGIERALRDLGPAARVQFVDISSATLPLVTLLAALWCRERGAEFHGGVVAVSGDAERAALEALKKENLPDDLAGKVSVLIASPLQIVHVALPAPFPPANPHDALTGAGDPSMPSKPPPDALLVCDDVVERSGCLRSDRLEEIAVAWLRCNADAQAPMATDASTAAVASSTMAAATRPRQPTPPQLPPQRRLRIVPESLTVQLTLIESAELLRRTRVVEQPCDVDVSCLNTLSVPVFMDVDEPTLCPRRLSAEVTGVVLPLGSPGFPQVLKRLEIDITDEHPLLVRLVATSAGRLHGMLTSFKWPPETAVYDPKPGKGDLCSASARSSRASKLAGIVWSTDADAKSPMLEVGDTVQVGIRYSSSRGLVFTPGRIERGSEEVRTVAPAVGVGAGTVVAQ